MSDQILNDYLIFVPKNDLSATQCLLCVSQCNKIATLRTTELSQKNFFLVKYSDNHHNIILETVFEKIELNNKSKF